MLRNFHKTTLVCVVAILFSLGGCSSSSDTTSTNETSTPAADSPSAPAPEAAGVGDFCAATGEQFDAAKGWMDEKVSTTDYLAAIDRTTPLAPPEIADHVSYVNADAKNSVEVVEGSSTPGPVDVEKLKASLKAWRAWTESNCSAEIAAKWKG